MSDKSAPKNNDHIEKALKTVLDNVSAQYKLSVLEIPAYQMSTLKTYLWLSSVFIAAEISIFKALLDGTAPGFIKVHWSVGCYATAFVALLFSAATFFVGIDSLRGRKPAKFPFGAPKEWLEYVLHDKQSPMTLNIDVLKSAIELFDAAIASQSTTIQQLATKLQRMSRSLIVSFCCILTTLIIAWY